MRAHFGLPSRLRNVAEFRTDLDEGHGPASHFQTSANGLFCEHCLPGVIGSVVGAAHYNSKTVTRGIFGKIIVGDSGVLLQPVFGRESFEGGREPAINLEPCLPKIGSRNRIGKHSVPVRDVDIIQLRMQSFAEAEQRKHAIMHGGQVTDKVEKSILVGGDLILELLVSRLREVLIEAANHELP